MPILALKTLKKWKGKWKGEEGEGEREPPPEPLVKPLAEPKYKVVLVRDKECVRLLSSYYYCQSFCSIIELKIDYCIWTDLCNREPWRNCTRIKLSLNCYAVFSLCVSSGLAFLILPYDPQCTNLFILHCFVCIVISILIIINLFANKIIKIQVDIAIVLEPHQQTNAILWYGN